MLKFNYSNSFSLSVQIRSITTDCPISDNSASGGGGITNYLGTVNINNSTISDNSAAFSDTGDIENSYGGGILN